MSCSSRWNFWNYGFLHPSASVQYSEFPRTTLLSPTRTELIFRNILWMTTCRGRRFSCLSESETLQVAPWIFLVHFQPQESYLRLRAASIDHIPSIRDCSVPENGSGTRKNFSMATLRCDLCSLMASRSLDRDGDPRIRWDNGIYCFEESSDWLTAHERKSNVQW